MPTTWGRDNRFRSDVTDVTAAPTSTPPVRLAGQVAVQITGTATAITAAIERSVVDPGADGSTGAWAPARAPITGNPSTGIEVLAFYEPGVAWWRVRVTAMTGAAAAVALSGGAA